MNNKAANNTIDIAIIGGGIAGLWALARLRQSGYQAILLEAKDLACMQTGASQGIIHGGTKYALTGKLTHSAQSIQKMPQRWKACLDGSGEVDLSQVSILSDHQYLWSNNIASKLAGFFASKVMTSRMQHLSKKDFLAPFDDKGFNGEVYQLDEPVLDIKTVIESIRQQFSKFIYQADINSIRSNSMGYVLSLTDQSQLSVKNVVITAGSGSESLLQSLNFEQPKMQRRPLHMPMLKASVLPKIYAHCLGASALPRMTISSHTLDCNDVDDNETVWYLGGEIAEQGINRSVDGQIKLAKIELQKLMPWMDFSSCLWATKMIDRAEPKMADGSRPSQPEVYQAEGIITAWPVKLAMVPIMVDKIMQKIEQMGIKKNTQPVLLADLPLAQTSQLPWQQVEHWQA